MLGEITDSANFNGLFLHQSGPWKMKLNGQVRSYEVSWLDTSVCDVVLVHIYLSQCTLRLSFL